VGETIAARKEFKPDAATQVVLKRASHEAHAWFMDRLLTYGQRFWPDAKWEIPGPPIGAATEFKWEAADYFDVDARGIGFFSFCAPPKKLGPATFYVGTFHDADGDQLRGETTYRLHVPTNVPAKQFWAVTVYSHEEATFIRDSARQSIDSFDPRQQRKATMPQRSVFPAASWALWLTWHRNNYGQSQ
jgi:hypothetical protein